MSDERPSIEEVADGLALWQEHKPRTLGDWKEIARRFSEEADGLRSQLEDREQRLREAEEAFKFVRDFNPVNTASQLIALRRYNEGARKRAKEALAALRSGRETDARAS